MWSEAGGWERCVAGGGGERGAGGWEGEEQYVVRPEVVGGCFLCLGGLG